MFSRHSRIAALCGLSSIALCTAALVSNVPSPASAQSYVQPEVITRAGTAVVIPGPGTVVVQVEILANGTPQVQKVIDTNNPGDISAALDIAKNSIYAPAKRNGKPVTSYYDFTLHFTAKSLNGIAPSGGNGGAITASSSGNEQIEAMIKTGNYTGAQSRLQAVLQRNPSDAMAHELLGLTYYYQKSFVSAANAYQQVPAIDKTFTQIAAQSFSNASISYATGTNGVALNLSLAQQYAQKSVQLAPTADAYFSLGIVQLKNKDNTDAVVTLKKARGLGFADPRTDAASRTNLDGALLQAYTQAGDLQDAQLVADEILKFDPKSTLPAQVLGRAYLQDGANDVQAKQNDAALANFEKAASYGDPQLAADAYAQAAFVEANMSNPDYGKVKGYADKAIAADPNNPLANWAEGVSYGGQYATSQSPDAKKQAQAYCTKASQLAKAQGNTALAASIDKYVVEANLK